MSGLAKVATMGAAGMEGPPLGDNLQTNWQECFVNWDRIEGDWKQFVGKVKEK